MQKVSAASGERVIFSINADTTKIHRRVKVRESDWGVSEALRHGPRRFGPTRLGLHQRHTSGVRLMGLVGRHALNLLGTCWVFVLTFVDDSH